MGDESAPDDSRLPDLKFLNDDSWETIHGAKSLEGSYLLMHENLADLSHLPFLHANTFGTPKERAAYPLTVERAENGIDYYRTSTSFEDIKFLYPPEMEAYFEGCEIFNRNGGITHSPAVVRGYGHTTVTDSAGKTKPSTTNYIMHYLTPETKNTAHYHWSISRNFAQNNKDYSEQFTHVVNQAFEEDLVAVKRMQKLLEEDAHDFREMVIAGDQAGMLVRRQFLGWAAEEAG